ncbi:hypothetical protein HN419_03335 [Candidatus Woesearchaeota archaeon]|jgi:VCBS repeat-containing protein|nr:hypothetical protein [Candidatus Woesearchaeota archaeon]MBT3536970.1 hypothetical protein [Candidatus Woesearchaeota archaeon]MBT4697580.1 hypothetical protein [Candidatus Woesearchaeota archaeon]MBT4717694.1 hypothetical protein [Candidatus Woesearchaeota archaeon]MBT7106720.1 hypothetical protein [Candidatus Woesearchaeota archaeon]
MKRGLIFSVVLLLFLSMFVGCSFQNTIRERFANGGPTGMVVLDDIEQVELIDDIEVDDELSELDSLSEDLELIDPVNNKVDADLIVKEGELVRLKLNYDDPDGDRVKFTFGPPLDENGEWQTGKGDSGLYEVDVEANDGSATVSKKFRILVDSLNHPPVLEDILDVVVEEGEIVEITSVFSDPENDDVTVTYSGWMTTSSYTTGFNDAGVHKVTVTVSDGMNVVKKDAKVVVNDVNRAPVLKQMSDIQMEEGDRLELRPVALDPDGDKLTLSFSLPLNSNGVWQSKTGDAGVYDLTVSVSDGDLSDEKTIKLSVGSANDAPMIEEISTITVKEGDTVTLMPKVTDPENEEMTITYSGWMTSDAKETGYDDAGVHKVVVTVSDGQNTVSQEVKVVVENVNRAPVFEIVN